MNKIDIFDFTGELRYKNTTVLTYKIQYSQITQSIYKQGQSMFNKYNKDSALNLLQYVKTKLYKEVSELYDYNSSRGYPVMVYEVVLTPSITFNDKYMISLYYDLYQFTGGAHGSTTRSSQTWDLRISKILPLDVFYPNNPYYIIDILKNINNQIKLQINSGSNVYFDDYCKLVLDTFNPENYYLTQNGIAIYFQQYDIAPYSSGIPVFYLNNLKSKRD